MIALNKQLVYNKAVILILSIAKGLKQMVLALKNNKKIDKLIKKNEKTVYKSILETAKYKRERDSGKK